MEIEAPVDGLLQVKIVPCKLPFALQASRRVSVCRTKEPSAGVQSVIMAAPQTSLLS